MKRLDVAIDEDVYDYLDFLERTRFIKSKDEAIRKAMLLFKKLSMRARGVVLGTQDKDAIPTELAKKIIYLWRQDQLATPTGLMALLEGAAMVDAEASYSILDELGLKEVSIAIKSLR